MTPATTFMVPGTWGVTLTVIVPAVQGQRTVVPGLFWSSFFTQPGLEGPELNFTPSAKTVVTHTFDGEPELPTCRT